MAIPPKSAKPGSGLGPPRGACGYVTPGLRAEGRVLGGGGSGRGGGGALRSAPSASWSSWCRPWGWRRHSGATSATEPGGLRTDPRQHQPLPLAFIPRPLTAFSNPHRHRERPPPLRTAPLTLGLLCSQTPTTGGGYPLRSLSPASLSPSSSSPSLSPVRSLALRPRPFAPPPPWAAGAGARLLPPAPLSLMMPQ